MSDEITVSETMTILKDNIDEQTRPNRFLADMTGTKGPTPGLITVPVTGKVVDLSALSLMGGMCRFYNRDDTNYVTIGVYDGTNFFPFCELLPGEFTRVRLSRFINVEFIGSSTGSNSDVNSLMIIANTAACNVLVQAYDA